MLDVEVIEDGAAATTALDPVRRRLLAALTEPGSAATLAERVGLPRQKVNYHLRALERHRLVEQVGERRWGGITERLFSASAAAYVVSPGALGEVAADPQRSSDRLSAQYVIALGARVVREVGALARRGRREQRTVATLGIDAEIAFATPEDRARFADELTATVTRLAAAYHHDGGRPHRLVVASHPIPDPEEQQR